MPICYEIDVEFVRDDEDHQGEVGRIPLSVPFPEPLAPDEIDDALESYYRGWLQKLLGSDPSRESYFGTLQRINVISIYEC